MNRQNGGVLLGLAALGALLLALQPKTDSRTSPASAAKREGDKKASLLDSSGLTDSPVQEGPTKPIWEFLGLTPPRAEKRTKRYSVEPSDKGSNIIEEPTAGDAAKRLMDWPTCCDLEPFTFRFLIATVPDPIDSGLAHEFDQVVEALQRAFEEDKYVIDRAWFPWARSTEGRKISSRLHETYPGLILFRTDETAADCSPRRLFALLLVGETPTAGIHRLAFANAVRVIHGCPGCKEEGNRIRVLGPYFSGSAVSLRLALGRTRKEMTSLAKKEKLEEPWIKVVCGSASGFSHDDFVNCSEGDGWVGSKNEKDPAFTTTVLPNEIVLHWARKYLGNPANPVKGESPTPLVVLHEANTAFGQSSVSQTQPPKNDSGLPELFYVPFPLHISQLRATSTKEQAARAESLGLPRAGRNLPFPSEEQNSGETGREAIAVRDPLMTAAIDDLILDNTVTTMAQKRGSHLCLVSTDVRDTLFLAQEIRDRQPDVQLITLGNDLLFTHEDYNYAMRGMIVASTYPLYPAFQEWGDLDKGKPNASRILFAKDSYEGCYNAALVHLAGKDVGRLNDRMKDYGWEGTQCNLTMPPLWISVVGSNGQMIPVTYISPAEYSNHLPEKCSQDHPENKDKANPLKYLYKRERGAPLPNEMDYGRLSIPNMWFFWFTVSLTINGWFFYQFNRYMSRSQWERVVASNPARFKQRADFAVGCLAQVLLYGKMAELAWTPLRAGLPHQSPLIVVAVLGMLVASTLMVVIAWLALVAAHRRHFSGLALSSRIRAYRTTIQNSKTMIGLSDQLRWLSRAGFWIVFSDLFMFLLVTLAVIGFVWRNFDAAFGAFQPQKVVYFERAIHLSNGVSPLLPRMFFCTVLFAWSFFLVKKLYLANHYAIESPFPYEVSASFDGLRGLHRDLHAELMPPSTLQKHFVWCLLMFGIVLIGILKLYQERTWPVDGSVFGIWSLIGFFASSFLLVFTLLQFYFAWRSLRKLLRALALLPMQSAFERLPDKVVAIFGQYLFSLRPRHSHLAIVVQQYYRLHRLFPSFFARLKHAHHWRLHIGPLDAATLSRAWRRAQRYFLRPSYHSLVARHFVAELNLVEEEELEPPVGSNVVEWGGLTGEDIHELTRRCLRVLYPFWKVHSMEEAFGRTEQAAEQAGHSSPAPAFLSLPEGDAVREWIVAAEDFIAVEIIRYLSQFIVQLRNLLTCLTLGSLLLVLTATVYPFSSQSQLLLLLTILGCGIAVFILSFLVQLNRDELISRINRSTPNRFTPDLTFLHGTTAYVLPILAGLMVQFPFVTSTLRDLLDPLFHIIK